MSTLDLDLLSNYLDGDQNEYGLDFAATHGFLCAIAVGPKFDRWLDELFESNQKKLPSEVLEQINLWLESIRQVLANENEFEEQLIDLTLPIMVFSGIDEEDPQMESFRRNGQLMDELAEEIPDNLNELYLMYHTPA